MANKIALENDIKTLRANLNNEAIPAEFKGSMKKQLEELEKKLAETVGKAAKPAIDKMAEKAATFKPKKYTISELREMIFGKYKYPNGRSMNSLNLSKYNDGKKEPYYDELTEMSTPKLENMLKSSLKDLFKSLLLEEAGKKYPFNKDNPYTHDIYQVNLKNGQTFKLVYYYGKPAWTGNVVYQLGLKIEDLEDSKEETEPVKKPAVDKTADQKSKSTTKSVDYDCDDLIAKEKEKLAKRKAREKKQANKSEPQKQRERVEKVTATVEKSIKERIKSGKPVTKKEVESLIDMYEKEIADLKKLLKTL